MKKSNSIKFPIPSVAKNNYSGFDPAMTDGDSMSISTLKLCYRKHVCNDESIGWDELCGILGDTLAQIMGDDEFCKWDRK